MHGGILRPIRRISVQDVSGALRVVYVSIAVTANFSEFSVSGSSSLLTISPSASVTVTGGTAPFTYAWTVVSTNGAPGTPTALTATSSTTAFRASALQAEDPLEVLFRCTVTDSTAATATVDVTATFYRIGIPA